MKYNLTRMPIDFADFSNMTNNKGTMVEYYDIADGKVPLVSAAPSTATTVAQNSRTYPTGDLGGGFDYNATKGLDLTGRSNEFAFNQSRFAGKGLGDITKNMSLEDTTNYLSSDAGKAYMHDIDAASYAQDKILNKTDNVGFDLSAWEDKSKADGFNWSGAAETGANVAKGLGDIMGAYTGFKSLGIEKDKLDFQKDAWAKQFALAEESYQRDKARTDFIGKQ